MIKSVCSYHCIVITVISILEESSLHLTIIFATTLFIVLLPSAAPNLILERNRMKCFAGLLFLF